MSAYVIVRVEVTNPEQYEQYKLLTPEAVAASGGTFIVRGGQHETLEGDADDRRVVVVEFPDYESAKAFYDSPKYRKAREVRAGAADMHMTVVEGA